MVKWYHLGKWKKAENKELVGPNYWFFAAGLIWNFGQKAFCLSYSISLMRNTAGFIKDSSWVSISEFIQLFLAKVAAMAPLKAVLTGSGMGKAHGRRAACPSTCSLQLPVVCAGPWHQLLPQTETLHSPYTPLVSPACSLINIMIKNMMVVK